MPSASKVLFGVLAASFGVRKRSENKSGFRFNREKRRIMMNKQTVLIGLLILIFGAVFNFGIVSASAGKRPDVKGKVVNISQDESANEDILGTLYVERVKESDSSIDKAYLFVTRKTQVLIQEGDVQTEAAFADIKKDDMISAYFEDAPVAMIYPLRIAARRIVILRNDVPKRECE